MPCNSKLPTTPVRCSSKLPATPVRREEEEKDEHEDSQSRNEIFPVFEDVDPIEENDAEKNYNRQGDHRFDNQL